MNNKLSQKFTQLYNSRWLPWIIIFLAIVLRFVRYLHNPSFGFDESSNAVDIISRTFTDLLGPSSDESMKYPYGFMVLEKLSVWMFGNSEYALRFPSFLFGILSVFFFYKVAVKHISANGTLVALGLFAVLDPLIFQSSNVKPYISDLAFALMIFMWADNVMTKKLNSFGIIFAGFFGGIIVWWSHTALFVLAGVGIWMAAFSYRDRDWLKIRQLLIVYFMWAVSFIACYFIYIQTLISNFDVSMEDMLMMERAFIPFPPKSINDIRWMMDNFFGIFSDPAGLTFTGLAAVMFLVGCFSIYNRNKEKFFLLISPIAVTFMASVLHQYPFKGRLIVFLIPFILIFFAEGVEYIRGRISVNSIIPGIILLGILFIYPMSWALYHAKTPAAPEDIRPVLKYIEEHGQKGDILYVHYYSQYMFEYYTKYHPEPYKVDNENVIIGIAPRGWYRHWRKQEVSKYYDADAKILQTGMEILKVYARDIDKLKGHQRVWFLFSAVIMKAGMQEEKFFLFHLDEIGKKIDESGKTGIGSVYLYDLSIEK